MRHGAHVGETNRARRLVVLPIAAALAASCVTIPTAAPAAGDGATAAKKKKCKKGFGRVQGRGKKCRKLHLIDPGAGVFQVPPAPQPAPQPAAPASLTINPASKNFGAFPIGSPSPATTFTATNVGGQPTGALLASVTGPNANDFTISANACAQPLAAAASCTLNVIFEPDSNGGRSAVLHVAGSPGGDAGSALSGNGL